MAFFTWSGRGPKRKALHFSLFELLNVELSDLAPAVIWIFVTDFRV